MELKYSEALCELAVSTRHTSKLILVETLCILGVIVKSLLALVRKELANCSTVLMLPRPQSFLPM